MYSYPSTNAQPSYPMSDRPGGGKPGETTPQGSDNEDDGHGRAPVLPTAPPPPTQGLDRFYGYADVSYDGTTAVPPSSYAQTLGINVPLAPPPNRHVLPAHFNLNAESLREALLDEVGQHCCWGSSAARNMAILNSQMATAFHYTLETFVETRKSFQTHKPYKGGYLDGAQNGYPPHPWEIFVKRPDPFKDGKSEVMVPHTEFVRNCYRCDGARTLQCGRCLGFGRTHCRPCKDTGVKKSIREGQQVEETCPACKGIGRRPCWSCKTSGRVPCGTCESTGQLKHYIVIKVEWKTHLKDFVLERSRLPDQLITEVSGQETFREQGVRVFPLASFPERLVVEASERLVKDHCTLEQSAFILMQRHRLQLVPVYEVKYEHNDERGIYFVYGFERKVYAPDYPQQCCCGCSIL